VDGVLPLGRTLQYQIAQALEPVVEELQQQLARSVRTRTKEALANSTRDRAMRGRPDTRDTESAFHDAGKTTRATPASPDAGGTTGGALRSALNTIRAWLAAVLAAVRRALMRLLATTVMAMLRPVIKAIVKRSLSSLQEKSMRKLQTVGAGASS
jgi:hypothetical protein